jgi:hypothetical protein
MVSALGKFLVSRRCIKMSAGATPVILATQKGEIRRSQCEASPGKDTLSQKIYNQKRADRVPA